MARLAGIAVLFCFALAAQAQLVIAHRGASGSLPEHTLAAYRMAIEQGADYIEADLVMTKDGVLVARHENEISATTDVAARSEFAARRTTRTIDGKPVNGWFTEDFTLREIKTLRAKERIPDLRPRSALHDGRYEVPALEEILLLLSRENGNRERERQVGIYPETKHPAYFQSIGLPLEEPLVALLEKYGYRGRQAKAFIQSFEPASLRKLAKLTQVPLVQLLSPRRPFELAAIAAYAQGIGPAKEMLIPRRADGSLGPPAALAREAHAHGLFVHAWTFRAENAFLPAEFRSAAGPAAHGDLGAELARYRSLGIEGLFTDHPALAR
jgi:glycerophosphoryl diester phosphodiesterase